MSKGGHREIVACQFSRSMNAHGAPNYNQKEAMEAPATAIDLSDRAKALLERNKIEQAVVDMLLQLIWGCAERCKSHFSKVDLRHDKKVRLQKHPRIRAQGAALAAPDQICPAYRLTPANS